MQSVVEEEEEEGIKRKTVTAEEATSHFMSAAVCEREREGSWEHVFRPCCTSLPRFSQGLKPKALSGLGKKL